MKKKLIVNADDFGIHPAVNEAVCLAHEKGILTSTSLMAGGVAFEDAVACVRQETNLGIGIHLTLVGGIAPVLPIEEVPSLVAEDGCFPTDYMNLLKRDLQGKICVDDIYREWDAQIKKVLETGLLVTHIDGHQHLHMWKRFFPIALSLALKYSIPCMRVSDESLFFGGHLSNVVRVFARAGLSLMARGNRRKLKENHVRAPKYFWGMLDGGHLGEGRLHSILHALQPGVNELMCHPSVDESSMERAFHWGYHGEEELQGLISLATMELIEKGEIELISYRELANTDKGMEDGKRE